MSDGRVYGIDLGTTYTCIAYVDDTGRPTIVANGEGELTTPSVVLFEDSETVVVGREAKNTAVIDSDRVVEMVKRQIGKQDWRWRCFDRDYSAEEISSYILRKVVDDAEKLDGVRPERVVITCPAYFGIAQREATAQAGAIAGLEVLEVINEPTAAAIHFGIHHPEDHVVLVYDLGGGTFDVTVVKIEGGAITVVATDGAHELGGRDWDEQIVRYLGQKWQAEHPDGDDPLDTPETVQDFWVRAENAKKTLSNLPYAKIAAAHQAKLVPVQLTRDEFNEMTRHLLESTISLTQRVMATARDLGHPEIDQILLVGGSTKMPQVSARLQDEFGLPIKTFDPEQAVAKGAATYGQKLAIGEKIQFEIAKRLDQVAEEVDIAAAPAEVRAAAEEAVAEELNLRLDAVKQAGSMQVKNVVSHSFGVRATLDGAVVIANLVLAQQPLPTEARQTFGTLSDGLPSVEIAILENTERTKIVRDLAAGQEIGQAVLELGVGLPENSPVEVTFSVDNEGRLVVTGRDASSAGGKEVTATIKTDRALSAEQVAAATEHARGLRVLG